jgi:hypothetical protein
MFPDCSARFDWPTGTGRTGLRKYKNHCDPGISLLNMVFPFQAPDGQDTSHSQRWESLGCVAENWAPNTESFQGTSDIHRLHRLHFCLWRWHNQLPQATMFVFGTRCVTFFAEDRPRRKMLPDLLLKHGNGKSVCLDDFPIRIPISRHFPCIWLPEGTKTSPTFRSSKRPVSYILFSLR